jgi:putative transposase
MLRDHMIISRAAGDGVMSKYLLEGPNPICDPGTRRIIHWNVTAHPTAAWTIQQFRAIVPGDQPQRFLIHDRDSVYAAAIDDAVTAIGLTVLKTPARCPQGNAFCERLIGTIRRECLD